MSINKSDNLSNLEIAITDNAIASLVEQITLNTSGVYELSQRFYNEVIDEITERFGTKRVPGITIKHNKKGLKISVYIIVTLTRNFIELATELQEKIYNTLKDNYRVTPNMINIHIEGIYIESQGENDGIQQDFQS